MRPAPELAPHEVPAAEVLRPSADTGPLLLICDHASCRIPADLADLGLDRPRIEDHIGWDVGAGSLTRALSHALGAPAVLSGVSRLVVDANRDPTAPDLVVATADGIPVPGNRNLPAAERARRLAAYHDPYHAAIDEMIGAHTFRWLLSLHSFTPRMGGRVRSFDVGVLFDDAQEALGRRLAERLRAAGLDVRLNEPYSGKEGMIYSVQRHGRTHDLPYLEVEVNNARIRDARGVGAMLAVLAAALPGFMEE